jgi:predicted ArsR family transcriptional regulator
MTVEQVAKRVGLPPNTARFHLESLVDAGFATRETQERTTPGRPKVAYMGTLPNQTHERAQAFRLLAEIMGVTVAQANGGAEEWMYRVGSEWGRFLATRGDSTHPIDEEEVLETLVNKLDALWYSPEVIRKDPPKLVLHNCPFWDSTRRYHVLCQLHAGMINGCLEEMRSTFRISRVRAQDPAHHCEAEFARGIGRTAKANIEVVTKGS